jgi:TPR repeat protein
MVNCSSLPPTGSHARRSIAKRLHLESGCEQYPNSRDCSDLAPMLKDGLGGVADTARAAALLAEYRSHLTAGCENGGKGCYALAQDYWSGSNGFPRDTVSAMKYTFRDCEMTLLETEYHGACWDLLDDFRFERVPQSVASRADPATLETVRRLLRTHFLKQQCGQQTFRDACDRMKRLYKK